MEVILVSNQEEVAAVAPVIQQLRPQYELNELIGLLIQQMKSGYQLAYVMRDGNVLSVAGFVTGQKLSCGQYLYIDDFVTDEAHRSEGAGQYLMDWFKDYAEVNHIDEIHLDSGVQRFAAHKFYLTEGFAISSHHFCYRC
ncbi:MULTISPECIES: GNAT family N-acetyltransferase [Photobacterium]|uniref:GNAT family N-acetyltransferase n=1 Tax=Photobacterium TaxID=657 RepID=UPI001A8D74A7|nr:MULTISPECIES: GNAT family N-acetyltransferase [Photobacterium]MBV1841769.1 GNAT family N-acetyltransferase [Photobacterium ganghwense]QSV16363.1 GNAT family N-acetyltransferase [Photobacterium ganghwense]